MAKKRTTKSAVKATAEKTLGDLPPAERASLLASFAESLHQLTIFPEFAGKPLDQYLSKIEDWIESHGLPRDICLAGQVALVDYGEFAMREDIEQLTPSEIMEIIKVVSAKKEWERKLAVQSNPHSSGWPTFTPAELRKLFDIGQDALVKRLKSQAIPNKQITTKTYRVDPSTLPDDWKRILKRG